MRVSAKPLRIEIVGGGPAGLYFALLMKKSRPDYAITVYERNRADDTFGFGVVFSDETLDNLMAADPESYRAITEKFAYWDEIDFFFRGECIRSTGHGFCGTERKTLLMILQQRCRALGVELHFSTELAPKELERIGAADVIVAADGVNSGIRKAHEASFETTIDWRKSHFIWMGSTAPLPAFTFNFAQNEFGIWNLCTYQYGQSLSTWVIEAPQKTWERAQAFLSKLSEEENRQYLEAMWRHLLGEHRLIANRSCWRRFPIVKNGKWHHGNIVLLGDALHTAHFSIGSGTKLAMEDAIALKRAFDETNHDPSAAFALFEKSRREEVEKTQYASEVSVVWTEEPHRYWRMQPIQAYFSMLSRAKAITYDNLRQRDADFVDRVDRWFAQSVAARGFEVDTENPPPPMFTPFRIGQMTVENRVMVSPMNMYSAEAGNVPGDFHLAHLGRLAMGGAGLVFAEMTAVSHAARITPACPGIYTDEQVRAWRRITDFCHAHSRAKLGLQLGHAGRKGSTKRGWEGMDKPLDSGNWEIVAASPLAFYDFMHLPGEITRAQMSQISEDYAQAAVNAERAGFDMLELHCGHGYLLSGFISPLSNARNDEYGGSLENRMRFPLEVFDAVRRHWPRHKPMSVRISASDWVPHGIQPEDSIQIASLFKSHGVDIVDVSSGQTSRWAQPVYGRMFQTGFSDKIRNEVDVPTITVGNITTADQVNTIIAAGRADIVALGRPHLTNPDFTLQAAAEYGFKPQFCALPYLAGKDAIFRQYAKARAEKSARAQAARPRSHAERRQQLLQVAG